MTREERSLEWWIAIVRFGAVPFAVLQVLLTSGYPPGYEAASWVATAVLAAGAAALYAWVRRGGGRALQATAMAFDFAIVSAFTVVFAFEPGSPTRQLLSLAIVAGAARFGLGGGLAAALAAVPVAVWFEERRAHFFGGRFRVDYVTFQAGAGVLMALLVGWLVVRLAEERATAEQRADEAEKLRDELGRRADLLDAANRCARALSSSLDMERAFGAFIHELRGLVPFDRTAIVLAEGDVARVIASAGAGGDAGERPQPLLELEHTLLGELIVQGQTVYRRDMASGEYAEEESLLRLGLRSRVASPLLVGARTVGLISVMRSDPDGFSEHEIELMSLLGSLGGSAVQNIRAYESERRTVEELRQLSALRADFVSLVSHELRSPMAAVIGAARTLQQRWRDLHHEQRHSFLSVIADETSRLATLISDVFDTSRIDAGTFAYRFVDVDVAALVEDSVAAAGMGQDEVPVRAEVGPAIPHVRADPARLRQVVGNLIDNAVKYSPPGAPVDVSVAHVDGSVQISVSDRGIGIDLADQRRIFEKFGRVAGGSKPGTGLGLYIARSIAEAHGGTLEVRSAPGRGATFTVKLPV